MINERDSKYMERISNHKTLSREKEASLFRAMAAEEDEIKKNKIRNDIIESNLLMVLKVANIYHKSFGAISLVDLVDAGIMGLVKSVDKFNVEYGNKLSTYAYPSVEREIHSFIHSASSSVHTPVSIKKNVTTYKKMVKKGLSDEEIMDDLGVSEGILDRIKSSSSTYVFSMHNKVEDEDGNADEIVDLIEDPSAPDIREEVDVRSRKDIVTNAINSLHSKDARVIKALFLDEETLCEVGKREGITAEAVRQRKNKALKALRYKLDKELMVM